MSILDDTIKLCGMVSSGGSWSFWQDPREFVHDSDKRIAETNMTYDRLRPTVGAVKLWKLFNNKLPTVSNESNVNT